MINELAAITRIYLTTCRKTLAPPMPTVEAKYLF